MLLCSIDDAEPEVRTELHQLERCLHDTLGVELDGGQHLGNADAYRRDRRKDLMLQENGYVALRFLAEDVGKRLDEVLDTILRALSHRRT